MKRTLVSETEKEEMRKLYLEGWTVKAIAQWIGCAPSTVYSHIRGAADFDRKERDARRRELARQRQRRFRERRNENRA